MEHANGLVDTSSFCKEVMIVSLRLSETVNTFGNFFTKIEIQYGILILFLFF